MWGEWGWVMFVLGILALFVVIGLFFSMLSSPPNSKSDEVGGNGDTPARRFATAPHVE
jgi:hypothetical protein